MKFFKQIQPKKVNREYLRKILGYSITGRTEARVLLFGTDLVVMKNLKYLK